MKADVCEIFTDVDGIYTTDPNICSDARKVEKVRMTRCWNGQPGSEGSSDPLGGVCKKYMWTCMSLKF